MGMPWNISKGTILQNLDRVCNDQKMRSAFLEDLEHSADSLLDIWKRYGVLSGNWHETHMREHWFNEQNGWWKDLKKNPCPYVQPLDKLFRQGLIKALRLASHDPQSGDGRYLPIDCYWICAAHHHFEIDICVSDYQVTFILLSPNVPDEGRHEKANTSLRFAEPIWVVSRMDPEDADGAKNMVTTAQRRVTEIPEICLEDEENAILVEQIRNFPENLPQLQLPPVSRGPSH